MSFNSFKHLEHRNKAWMAAIVTVGGLTRAMREQRKVKPEAFPVGNRAARRLMKSKAKDKPL